MEDRIQFEKERLELERQRLEIEQMKAEREKGFFYRNFSVIMPAVISLAATIITLTNLYVGYQQKKQDDLRLRSEKEREYKMQVIKFVFDNKAMILGKEEDEKHKAKILMEVAFPAEIYNEIFTRLEKSSPKENKQFWQDAQSIYPKVSATEKTGGYSFDLFLVIPPKYREQIEKVEYTFNHPSFGSNNKKISEEIKDGFRVNYSGWGAIDDVDIKVFLKDREPLALKLNMLKSLGWE
jgi:hypothetical protein